MSCHGFPSERDLAIIQSLPFDYAIVLNNAKSDSLTTRLRTERSIVEDARLVLEDGRPVRVGALAIGVDPLEPHAKELLQSLSVQSFPPTATALLPASGTDPDYLDIWAATMGRGLAAVISDVRLWLERACLDLVVVLGEGTIAHPSLFMSVARSVRREKPDFMVWNHILATRNEEVNGIAYLRCPNPNEQPIALAHADICGPSWAVSPAVLAAVEGPLETRLLEGGRHPFTIEVFRRNVTVSRSTEFIGAQRRTSVYTHVWPKARFAISDYKRLLDVDGFTLVVNPMDSGQPIRRSPVQRARGVDVVINFRNRAEWTIRAFRSIEEQDTDAKVTVILVDNQSDPGERSRVEKEILTARNGVDVQILSYNQSFNHSAQNNLAVAAGEGEVLFFMSNDCVLSPGVLDEMAAWALVPGVGVVGPRIQTTEGELRCSGMSALYLGQNFYPDVVEGFDHHLAGSIREVLANTFACACVSRAVFEQAGPLDEVDFPIGLNDIEYSLRLIHLGYRNLYLGPLVVRHEALGSRLGSDDGAQACLLRELYPSLFLDKDRRFEFDFPRQAQASNLRRHYESKR